MAPDSQSDKSRIKWYLRPVAIVVAILTVGPLALPLVWMSPAFKKWHKVLITVGLVFLTIWLVKASAALYNQLMTEMQDLQGSLK